MSETSTETTEDVQTVDAPEGDIPDATLEGFDSESDPGNSESVDSEPDVFPREVVEKLRRENGKHRQRAQQVAERLHTELVRATGRLADPTDLTFSAEHLDDADSLTAAIDELLDRKPHLATRRPSGDVGQGQRGTSSEPFSLLGLLKERT